MEYGQIAGNRSINTFIYRCFEYISKEDQQKFVKKFREQQPDSDQRLHTFRELVLGAYLSSCGFKVRHHHKIDSKTPDWCILDDKSVVTGIIECTSFHIDKTKEDEIEIQRRAKGFVWYWRDENKNNVVRLDNRIQEKAQQYKALVEKLGVPYIIAIYPNFEVAIDFKEELCPLLFDEKTGLFKDYHELSGVLYFEENAGRYSFRYAQNPNALRVILLPDGIFPPHVM
jgi:hypothetical protein